MTDTDGDEKTILINAPRAAKAGRSMTMPFLVIMSGAEKGKKILLSSAVVSIGRSRENIIFLDDPLVSFRHAEIHVEREKIILRDLDSRNGTTVNGRRCRERDLQDGYRLAFGNIEMMITIPGADRPWDEPLSRILKGVE